MVTYFSLTLPAVNNFLLMSTSDAIYYLPIPPPTSSAVGTPKPLPIGPLSSVGAITYDPRQDAVLWMDSEDDTLYR